MNKQRAMKLLKKKLDSVHSEFIRMAEGDKCYCCGATDKPTCGHLFSRRSMATRWDITDRGNCHVQCWPCNFRHGGRAISPNDKYPYWRLFIERNGIDALDELNARAKSIKQWTLPEMQDLYEKLKHAVMTGTARME